MLPKIDYENVVNIAFFFFTIPLFFDVISSNMIFYYFIKLTSQVFNNYENIVKTRCVNILLLLLLLYMQVQRNGGY